MRRRTPIRKPDWNYNGRRVEHRGMGESCSAVGGLDSATTFAANAGTGLSKLNTRMSGAQTTGRLRNGADFNVAHGM